VRSGVRMAIKRGFLLLKENLIENTPADTTD
jgi:hypothetical protein